MGKKALPPEELKIKMSISLDRELVNYMKKITNNKSKFIEQLLRDYYNKNTSHD